MSKSIVTEFCELYRKYHQNPEDDVGKKLVAMLDRMTPKQVQRAHKALNRENIEIGAARVDQNKGMSPNFNILHMLSLGASKRWKVKSKKRSITR